MAKQNDPVAPGQAEVSAVADPSTAGLMTVEDLGRLTGNITRRRRAVNFGGAAGDQVEIPSMAHRVATSLHGWTPGFRLTREAYEAALQAAMPERIKPVPPAAPPKAKPRDPDKRRAFAAKQAPRAQAPASAYTPHVPALNREVIK